MLRTPQFTPAIFRNYANRPKRQTLETPLPTDLAEVTQSVGAVAAVDGHRDLRTTSRYFHAREPAAIAPLRARTALLLIGMTMSAEFRGTSSLCRLAAHSRPRSDRLSASPLRLPASHNSLPSLERPRSRCPSSELRPSSDVSCDDRKGDQTEGTRTLTCAADGRPARVKRGSRVRPAQRAQLRFRERARAAASGSIGRPRAGRIASQASG